MTARCLNSRCDFKEGFFSCSLLIDTVQLVLQVETKHGKHTLKQDKEKRTEKFRPWAKWTNNDGTKCTLDSLTPSISSDSGAWLPTPVFEYKPKLFKDPRNTQLDKENMPPLENIRMPILNIEENDFLDRTEKLLRKDTQWEAQQVPLPRLSFPFSNDNWPSSMEQLEPETDDDMDIRDFSERPANDRRPPKPPSKPKMMVQDLIPPPDYSDHVPMNVLALSIPNPQFPEICMTTPEKKKLLRGWPTCLKRSQPKATFHTNDIYSKSTESCENLYEEPREKQNQEEHGPKEKNMRVFYKLNVKENVDITSTPHKEEYDEQNYESAEEWETAL